MYILCIAWFWLRLLFQCPVLYEKVNNTIGQPGLKNPNFTMSVFRNLGKVMCGMSVDDLKLIPATKSLEDIVGHLIGLECLSDKQVIFYVLVWQIHKLLVVVSFHIVSFKILKYILQRKTVVLARQRNRK